MTLAVFSLEPGLLGGAICLAIGLLIVGFERGIRTLWRWIRRPSDHNSKRPPQVAVDRNNE